MDVPVKHPAPKGDTCRVEDCDLPPDRLGYCTAHYMRSRSGAEMAPPVRPRGRKTPDDAGDTCAVPGCTRPRERYVYCWPHYMRSVRGADMNTPIRDSPQRRPNGSRRLNAGGYVEVKTPDGWILEHRLNMMEHLGRDLEPHEQVHHRYADRTDNRIEKLELWTRSQPSGGRAIDKLEWAEEIIALYGPLRDAGKL